MENVVEKTGKTIEEALQAALIEIGAKQEQVKYEVVEEKETKGLFGLFAAKQVTVRVSLCETDPAEAAKEFLRGVFNKMDKDVFIEVFNNDDGTINLELHGRELGILIGKHGQTLDSLQHLINLAANKNRENWVKITIDVENYRKRRVETLNRLAIRLAEKVKRKNERVALEPMSAHERKIIHMALQDDRRIATFSEGEDPFRHVVITVRR